MIRRLIEKWKQRREDAAERTYEDESPEAKAAAEAPEPASARAQEASAAAAAARPAIRR